MRSRCGYKFTQGRQNVILYDREWTVFVCVIEHRILPLGNAITHVNIFIPHGGTFDRPWVKPYRSVGVAGKDGNLVGIIECQVCVDEDYNIRYRF